MQSSMQVGGIFVSVLVRKCGDKKGNGRTYDLSVPMKEGAEQAVIFRGRAQGAGTFLSVGQLE